MLFHRRQDAQIALHPPGVVVMDIVLDRLNKLPLTGEPSAVIAFPLQNAPEALHRAVVNAMRHTGHTLRHSRLHELVVESAVGVLEPSVAMKQGMRIRIGLNSLIKGLENQRVIVAFTEYIGHNTPVTEIQNGAQIEFVNLGSLVPLEFCYISEPLLIGLCGIKLSVQKILGKILRIFCMSGAAMVVVLDRGTDISDLADAENPLVVDMNDAVMAQIVIEPPVALIRTFRMELFEFFRKPFILRSPPTQLPRSPLVVSRTRRVEQLAGWLNGITIFLVCFPDRSIDAALSYFRKASLLSISSNFFSRSRSISARYSLCLSCSISIRAFSSSVLGT